MMDGSGISLDEATQLDVNRGGYVANLSRAWEIWGPTAAISPHLRCARRGCGPRSNSRRARSPFPFWDNVEHRPLDEPNPNQQLAVVREWARFRPIASFDDPFVDAARPLILLDTYGYPATYRKYGDGPYIAPNLDTSVWFHRFSPRLRMAPHRPSVPRRRPRPARRCGKCVGPRRSIAGYWLCPALLCAASAGVAMAIASRPQVASMVQASLTTRSRSRTSCGHRGRTSPRVAGRESPAAGRPSGRRRGCRRPGRRARRRM